MDLDLDFLGSGNLSKEPKNLRFLAVVVSDFLRSLTVLSKVLKS